MERGLVIRDCVVGYRAFGPMNPAVYGFGISGAAKSCAPEGWSCLTSRGRMLRVLKVLDLGSNSGPHCIALTPDEKHLVISDYFLNEDAFGKVHAEGDHKIHVARISEKDLVLDPRFSLDFSTAFATGPARPHGLAVK